MKAAVESTPDEIINLLMKFEEQTNFNCYNFMKLVTHSVQHFGPNLEVSNYDHPSIRALIEKASKALSVRRVETDSICSTLLTVLQMYVPLAKAEFVDGASCTREQSTNFKNRAKNSSSISEFTRFKLENSQQSVSSKADTYRMKIRRTETSEDAGEQSLLVWQPSITKDVDGNQECCISIDYLEGAPKWYGSVAEAHEAFDFSSVVRGKYSTAKELTTGRQSKNIKSLFLKEAPNQIFTELNFMESLQKPSIISPTQAKLMSYDSEGIRAFYNKFFNAITQLTAKYSGKILKSTGDGLASYFPKTIDHTDDNAIKDFLDCCLERIGEYIDDAKEHSLFSLLTF